MLIPKNVRLFQPSFQLLKRQFSSSTEILTSQTSFPRKIFSGIQPTGSMHLGNYLGAVYQWKNFQNDGEDVTVMIADLHSITLPHNPQELSQNLFEMTATLIACGINPDKVTLFQQSMVPEHTELCWCLGCIATMPRLAHLPAFKEKSATLKDVPLGLYIYPVLQAADILAYKSTHIPVGEDQNQHIQLTQELAKMFNNRFGNTFPIPQSIIIGRELNILGDHEMSEIKQMTDALWIFEMITTEISAEKNVCISKVLYFIRIMKVHVSANNFPDANLSERCRNMIITLRHELSERFDRLEDNELITQATLLDPRFKKYGFINPYKYEQTVEKLKNILELHQQNIPRNTTQAATSATTQPQQKSPTSIKDVWDLFDSTVRENDAYINPRAAAILEIDRYLKEPLLERNQDPLKWWQDRQAVYPILTDLMKKRLCIIATSVPCERQFSKAGLIMSERRSRMKGDKLSKVMFLNSNIE